MRNKELEKKRIQENKQKPDSTRVLQWMALVLGCVWLCTGCVREHLEDCPPLTVKLTVKDKNYDNIDHVAEMTGLEERVDESLPFSAYIYKVFYALYRKGEPEPFLVKKLYEVEGEAVTHDITFPQDLPFGDYALVVWANMDTHTGLEADGHTHTYRMHGGEQEGYDVYLSCDTLHYTEKQHEFTLPLQRIKGKLLIEAVELPRGIHLSHKRVSSLYAKLDRGWNYSGKERVRTDKRWNGTQFSMVVSTFLAPTVQHTQSNVTLQFLNAQGEMAHLPQPHRVQVQLERNRITVLRYVYDALTNHFDVYLLLNDGWMLIHDMGLEE